MVVRMVAALCAVTLVSACSARVQESNVLPQQVQTPNESRFHTKRPNYVAASTKGMTVHIAGLVEIKKAAALTITPTGCKSRLMTLQCELNIAGLKACPSKKSCYSANVITYDRFVNGKIPPGAHALSAAENVAFHVASALRATVPIVLQGIPASVAFAPNESSSLQGSQSAGFVLPKCSASQQHVSVYGVDADGNYILGIGAPRPSLTTNDPAQLGVSASSANAFTLSPPVAPMYPFGGHTIDLTATATPGAHGMGTPVHATIHVTYSGDICGTFTEFSIPTSSSGPVCIAAGSDGALWFTENSGNKIGRIPANATSGAAIDEFTIPTANSNPFGITAGPGGDLWFAETGKSNIGRIPLAARSGADIVEIPASGTPVFIAAGRDGNVWYTEYSGNNVTRMLASATPLSPQITQFTIPTSSAFPEGIVAGPNGSMWVAEYNVNKIGTIVTSAPTTVTEYTVASGGSPTALAVASDGALWFTAQTGNGIDRMIATGAVTSTYSVPTASSGLQQMTAGRDGALWFAEQLGNKIGRSTLDGAITEFTVPTAASQPTGIVLGPDGAIWFTEKSGNKIGRLR